MYGGGVEMFGLASSRGSQCGETEVVFDVVPYGLPWAMNDELNSTNH
jgi:hypothetical protein